MTTPTVGQLVQMRRPRMRPSLAGYFAEKVAEQLAIATSLPQPCERYQADPCGFSDDVLGISLWSKQKEILEAVRDHLRVSVRSGHKCGKSTTAAVIALWFYFCWEDARVVLSSVTSRQVDQILWREIRKLRTKSKQHIKGEMHELARSGFKADARLGDFREIVGFTAREAEAVAGISGANLIYILDEASGIPEEIFEAIEGNRAGGARLVMMSNPTRTEGEFFLSHTEKQIREGNDRGFYKTVHVSSEDTPNVIEGHSKIPGLAGREWVEEKRREWGEDSPLFKVRVRGEFVVGEDGKILSLHALTLAEERWQDACDVDEDGKPTRLRFEASLGALVVSIDPAGAGEGGDESGFAARRGLIIGRLFVRRALTHDGHVAEARGLVRELRAPGEVPTIIVDREGPDGYEIWKRLVAIAESSPHEFRVVGIRASDKAHRQPHLYDRMRDELWANLAAWVRDGGALPRDAKLSAELHAPAWEPMVNGRLKATPKRELRKILGRSPDRGDAVALAAWQPTNWDPAAAAGMPVAPPAAPAPMLEPRAVALDPYAGADAWGGRR